jgi:hypothetical protein
MRLRQFFIALAFSSVGFVSAANALPEKAVADQQLFSQISLGFSKIPFNAQAKNIEINLAETSYVGCGSPWNCRFTDADHVDHHFSGDEGRLSGKWLYANYFDNKSINALGIGMMRQKNDVLKQISLFLSDTEYTCFDKPTVMANLKYRYSGLTGCKWALGKGKVEASFDDKEQLTAVGFSSVTP